MRQIEQASLADRRSDARRDQSFDVPQVRTTTSADDAQSGEPLCPFSVKRAELLRVTAVSFSFRPTRAVLYPKPYDPNEVTRQLHKMAPH